MRINILGVGFDNVTMDEALARGVHILKTIRVKYAKLKSEKLYAKVINPCKKHIVNGGILSIPVVS